MPVLAGDRGSAFDPRILSDPRVTNLWDGDQLFGIWFQTHGGAFWDRLLALRPRPELAPSSDSPARSPPRARRRRRQTPICGSVETGHAVSSPTIGTHRELALSPFKTKTPELRGFEERMKGLEPSTFCMATRPKPLKLRLRA